MLRLYEFRDICEITQNTLDLARSLRFGNFCSWQENLDIIGVDRLDLDLWVVNFYANYS